MRYLKQNTAVTIVVGLFVDYADGKTLLTDNVTFDPTDLVCELIKGNSSSELTLSKTGGSNDLNLTGKGMATFELAVGNVDTLGQFRLSFTNDEPGGVSTETILAFCEDFEVLPANVYDSMFSTDKLQVDVAQINGDDFEYSTTLYSAVQAQASAMSPVSFAGFEVGNIITIDTNNVLDPFSFTFYTHIAVITGVPTDASQCFFSPPIPYTASAGKAVKVYQLKGLPTKVVATLSTQAKADINAECTDAISDASLGLAAKVLTNKTIQNKTTGVITVYDDDGVTPVLYLTPSDDGSDITLTPSTPS